MSKCYLDYFPIDNTGMKQSDFKIGDRVAHIVGTFGTIYRIDAGPDSGWLVSFTIEGTTSHFNGTKPKIGDTDGSGVCYYLYHCDSLGMPLGYTMKPKPRESRNRFELICLEESDDQRTYTEEDFNRTG